METALPEAALLTRYSAPHYTDCFSVRVAGEVSLERFVYAFYTAPLFRCERWILVLIGCGSTDEEAQQLVKGNCESFAAWTVEDRAASQLLMCDVQKRTRSWFMVKQEKADDDLEKSATRLYFGSAVTADDASGPPSSYQAFLRLHRLYSRMLLRGAVRRLAHGP